MKYSERLPDLFKKLVANAATEEEVATLLLLIRNQNASADLHEVMEDLWLKKINGDHQEHVAPSNAKKPALSKIVFSGIAAVICMCLLSFYLWSGSGQVKTEANQTISLVSQRAGNSKTSIIVLSDGSKVTLNSGSVIRYPKIFAGKKREVYLEGEAYFEIKHDEKKAFLVQAKNMTTSVLGTSFNIMAYPDLPDVAVTVITGKVAVKNNRSSDMVLLQPKQRAIMKGGAARFKTDSVANLSDVIAWSTGELIFNEVTLEEIAVKLGYHFGAEISILNAEKKRLKFSGTFNTQTLPSILDAITEISGTHYKIEANTCIIY